MGGERQMGVRAEYHGNKKRFLGVLRRKEEKMEKEKEKKTKIPPPGIKHNPSRLV